MVTEPEQRQHQESSGRLTSLQPIRIGPFRIGRTLGEGGMGRVFLGRHERSGEAAAVKLLKREHLIDPVSRERFRQEVDAARRVPRFCTARVLDADPDADQPWVAIEYIDGPSLEQVLAADGRLAGRVLEEVAVGVAAALREIHAHGVIHRDLKPANVLLSPLGPRVIDFGIARVTADDNPPADLTPPGTVMGTLAYMAPEQLYEEEPTPAVDVFAWGGVVTAAATGHPPFGAGWAAQQAILSGEPDLGEMAEPLRALVAEALDKQPENRPSAAELVRRLSAVGTGATTEVLANAGRGRRRRRWVRAAAVLAAAVAVVLAVATTAAVLLSTEPLPLAGETVTIGVFNGWDEGIAATFLWKAALESQGAEVAVQFADVEAVYAGVASGELDLAFDAWLPYTHEGYWQEYGDRLEDLGAWYDGAVLTVAVNQDAPITSLAELADAADEFGNQIIGIEAAAGLTKIVEEQVRPAYGLADMRFLTDSASRMLVELENALAQGSNIVVTLWEPHWAYLAFPIRNLADPAGALGDPERIHAFARPGFTDDFPLLAGWVAEFTMSELELTTLESAIFHEEEAGIDEEFEAAVHRWLAGRPGYIDRMTAA